MKLPSEKHLFAIFWNQPEHALGALKQNNSLLVTNADLCHRIQTILRLETGDHVIVFDHNYHLLLTLTTFTKKQITATILTITKNKKFEPSIMCALPLLKREALETAVDALTQLGATTIQLISTQKSQRSWTEKDFMRLQKIIWAAAEQSKNFSFPTLHAPLSLNDFLKSNNQKNVSIFFDPQGEAAFDVVTKYKKNKPHDITLLIGPEGDLTTQEKELIKEYGFNGMKLTPTILRAEQALALGVGLFRSL
jgi:16S rRNA (uracil1498-N3)-methyltransferase